MSRKKQYNEEEVIEKAMFLFWRRGYEGTSIRMLEREMGINQFSIYSSFGSKQGVFVESIKFYKEKLGKIANKLKKSNNGVEGIKQYFIDFITFSQESEIKKGCMVTNIVNELGNDLDELIWNEVKKFTTDIKNIFKNNLRQNSRKSEETIEKQANYLLISMQGFSSATKVYSQKELDDYIETTFENL